MRSICSKFSLLSINKFNILSWYVKDHGNRNDKKIENLKKYIIKLSKIKKFDDIYLLCFPRIFNFGFNPISIYFFSYNNQITHTIYEVKNTFGDIHHYITKNKVSKRPIQIIHFSTGKEPALLLQPRNLIVVTACCQARETKRNDVKHSIGDRNLKTL